MLVKPVLLLSRADVPLARFRAPVGVAQKRQCASSSIFVAAIGKQRTGTDAGVETGSGITPERLETNRRIVLAAGQAQKSALSLCGVASRIASFRWRTDCLRSVWQRETGQCERD